MNPKGCKSCVANDNGFFQIDNLTPGTAYEVTISAKSFANWKSSEVILSPGQFDILNDIKLTILGDAASVTVVASREELAVEQVKVEEQQRVLGFISNFYVSYDKDAAQLTSKLKFELALKVAIDPVTWPERPFLPRRTRQPITPTRSLPQLGHSIANFVMSRANR